eukprot:tig00000944_g5942.t1
MEEYKVEPIKIVENTYKLGPDDHERFNPSKVKRAIDEIFQRRFKKPEDAVYDANTSVELTKSITDEVREAVKKLSFKRHKLVVQVIVGEMKGQGIRVASRCLWDVKTDDFASHSYSNASLYVVAMVFGTYYE